jgi:choline dehydrogenase
VGYVNRARGFDDQRALSQAPDIQLLPLLIDLSGGQEPAFTRLVALLTPESRGTVRLQSTNAADNAVVDMGYLDSETDRRLLIEGLRRTMELGESPIMRSLIGPPKLPAANDDATLNQALKTSAISVNHTVGTCRAGVDETSVVDPTLRVHGLSGLHVIDSSVTPTVPRGNVHGPSIMIGERGAEILTAMG